MDANDTCAICGYGGLATDDGNDICLEKRGNQPGLWQGFLIVFPFPYQKGNRISFFYFRAFDIL